MRIAGPLSARRKPYRVRPFILAGSPLDWRYEDIFHPVMTSARLTRSLYSGTNKEELILGVWMLEPGEPGPCHSQRCGLIKE